MYRDSFEINLCKHLQQFLPTVTRVEICYLTSFTSTLLE